MVRGSRSLLRLQLQHGHVGWTSYHEAGTSIAEALVESSRYSIHGM